MNGGSELPDVRPVDVKISPLPLSSERRQTGVYVGWEIVTARITPRCALSKQTDPFEQQTIQLLFIRTKHDRQITLRTLGPIPTTRIRSSKTAILESILRLGKRTPPPWAPSKEPISTSRRFSLDSLKQQPATSLTDRTRDSCGPPYFQDPPTHLDPDLRPPSLPIYASTVQRSPPSNHPKQIHRTKAILPLSIPGTSYQSRGVAGPTERFPRGAHFSAAQPSSERRRPGELVGATSSRNSSSGSTTTTINSLEWCAVQGDGLAPPKGAPREASTSCEGRRAAAMARASRRQRLRRRHPSHTPPAHAGGAAAAGT
ncbi:hypothetical protein KM043_005771 [Ampulex compressa]|nr:hypothetical protein KM043_005771 [Ampulex compressa]